MGAREPHFLYTYARINTRRHNAYDYVCGILASHDYTLINIVVIGVAVVGLFFFRQRIMAGHKLQLIFGSCLTRGCALFTLNT